MLENSNPVRVVTLGASLTANKGAAAMLTTVNQRLPEYVGACRFSVLSTDPTGDTLRIGELRDAEVFNLEPARLALIEIPMAVLAIIARLIRIPRRWIPLTRAGRELAHADIAVDLAGISFVDSRGLANLVYNTLMSSLPLLHGTPTAKAAQAIGPARKPTTRLAARLVLRRMRWIGARGGKTRAHLDELSLPNVDTVADLAFSLHEEDQLPHCVADLLPGNPFIAVMPSIVVERLVDEDPSQYLSAMATLIDELTVATGLPVVIAAHSYEQSNKRHRMNDRPTLLDLYERLNHLSNVTMIDEELTAAQLRSLISRSQFLVTSRFHAMISALATSTPVFVIGWSHKYREVLDDFGLGDLGASHNDLASPALLATDIARHIRQSNEIRKQIREALPAVVAKSEVNFQRIASMIGADQ